MKEKELNKVELHTLMALIKKQVKNLDGVGALVSVENIYLKYGQVEINRIGLIEKLYRFRSPLYVGMVELLEDVAEGWADRSWPAVRSTKEAIGYHTKMRAFYAFMLKTWMQQADSIAESKAILGARIDIMKSYLEQINELKI